MLFRNRYHFHSRNLLVIYLFVWFLANLFFLTDFPFMHTDEPWLSGLTRNMLETGRLDATEPFYDLYERHPHAVKVIYHLFQMLFIKLFGYSLFSVRLLSLTAGLGALILFYSLILSLSENRSDHLALFATVWLSVDIQFIYAAHTARQEMMLIMIMLLSLFLLAGGKDTSGSAASGAISGLAAGLHPNAFITAFPAGLVLLLLILQKKRSVLQGILFILCCAGGAGLFAALSFRFNPHFIHDYLAYGEPLGVTEPADLKILRWPQFHRKIYSRLSGTYYLPDVRWQYWTWPLLLLGVRLLKKPHRSTVFSFTETPGLPQIYLCGLAGVNLGILLIGKFSPPSVVFLTPFYYLTAYTFSMNLKETSGRKSLILPFALFAGTLLFSSENIREELHRGRESYREFTSKVKQYLPDEKVVLGSLALEYLLENGHLYEWRNLSELPPWKEKTEKSPVEIYIRQRKIDYIIIPDEIAFIYRNRPVWNVLYGNTAYWYPQMEQFLKQHCELAGEFDSPGYGVRIAAYRYRKPWPVKVYKVLSEEDR